MQLLRVLQRVPEVALNINNRRHVPTVRHQHGKETQPVKFIEGFMNLLSLLIIGIVIWAIAPVLIKLLSLLSALH